MIVSAPGRVTLFGEHQDYLQMPVIPLTINLRLRINCKRTNSGKVVLKLPDINKEIQFSPVNIQYSRKREYFKSTINVLCQKGLISAINGISATVRSNIPISAGLSSSSALVVAWMKSLLLLFSHDKSINPTKLAYLAYLAEVREFNEPGGMQDHVASSLGGINYIDFENLENPVIETIFIDNFPHVMLGDSQTPKDTLCILNKIKQVASDIERELKQPLFRFSLSQFENQRSKLTKKYYTVGYGLLRTRELTKRGKVLLQSTNVDYSKVGELINEQHHILRNYLFISTPKIDKLCKVAISAGALGAKITGSGGGGCMLALLPPDPSIHSSVHRAIVQSGGKPRLLTMDIGVKKEEDL